MKIIVMLFTVLLAGCGTKITVPIDATLLNEQEATVIIFNQQGFKSVFPVYLDKKHIGIVTSEKLLKFSVKPGEHELYAKSSSHALAFKHKRKQVYQAGEIYYMLLSVDIGVLVSSIKIEPTYPRKKYEVTSHKKEKGNN